MGRLPHSSPPASTLKRNGGGGSCGAPTGASAARPRPAGLGRRAPFPQCPPRAPPFAPAARTSATHAGYAGGASTAARPCQSAAAARSTEGAVGPSQSRMNGAAAAGARAKR